MDQVIVPVPHEIQEIIAELSKICDGERLVEVLSKARRYLGGGANPAMDQEIAEFNRTHYTPFLRFLVAQMGPQWFDFLTSDRMGLWDSFFLEGPADQAFLVLMDSLVRTGPCVRLDRCVHVLEKFLQNGALAEVIWEVCQQQLEATPTPILHEAILSKICSLPDHVANCLQKHTKEVFFPKNYYPRVGNAILCVLKMVSVSLRDGKGCSISFVSQLLGKVCMQGRHRELFSVLVPRLTTLVQSDCIWQRICWRLIESVPDRWMEPVVTGLVQMADGPATLSKLLGDLVLKNKKAQFLLTQKMLFLQYGTKRETLQNILGYLSMEKSCRPLLVKALKELLEVWSSSSVVKHSPYPQLLYLSRSIFISLNLLNKEETEGCKQEILFALTSGTRLYLDSSLPPVRCLGMVVAECLSRYMEPGGPSLSFQYQEDEEIKDLKALLTPPSICAVNPEGAKESSQSIIQPSKIDNKQSGEPKADTGSDSEVDSDDDLTPYDMSADTELRKDKIPAYIRDCLEALLSNDVEKLEGTMTSLSSLIRSNPSATKEVSAELVKILLHLEDCPGVENFTQLRYAAMVSVTVIDPIPVSQYITGEFYALNYSLRQRMDILDILVAAAQELSESVNPKKGEAPEKVTHDLQSTRSTHGNLNGDASADWRKIVEERIANKTRRFAKSQKATTPASTPNRFHAVVGHFFFPLIQNYDKPVVTFDLLGEDRLILGRLVHTLGILMHLALNAMAASQMGKALLEFVWVLRFHTDPFVRQGLLFCVSTILLSVPWERLMTDMSEEVLEMKCWLADAAETDADDHCRRLALNALLLMEKLRSNLQPPTSEPLC
ncbi:telomere length regulation protein TEL2 homolog [Hyla sarda]|uniref:telomere length regulation protein TEL2 homolog n=1 Tax=Hyla sarda TaxID=327740 RepID=UPI0024C3A9F0|nr:telomere length regulation protein TEL2 homolog [Hyla sarda]XP_056390383.1 telomere length regulation protein TEL2 homolog [Hyla sarda]XP_056390384.1 telomere length regulation protein TEL2 homolog [Hyla sarda]XP_056390385.1 telomere length regulation protein TEL2 homolog [Hyla sarda]